MTHFLRMFSGLRRARTSQGRTGRVRRPFRPSFEALEIRDVPSATFSLVNDWGSGFQGQIVVKNDVQPSTIQSWTLQFDMPYSIDSIWNASVVSHVGSRY